MIEILNDILDTKSIECTDDSVEIHVLTCKRDVLLMFWNLKSFYHFNKVHYRLIIHTDGTIDNIDKININKHFIGSRIIDLNEADAFVSEKLINYPYCKQLRDTYKKYPFLLKVFDPYFFCSSNYYLVFDSDLLFFTPTTKVISYINELSPFYFGGHWGWLKYPVSIHYLQLKGFKPVGNLNAGILGLRRDSTFFNLDFIERYIQTVKKAPKFFLTANREITPNIDYIGNKYTGEEEPLYSVLIGESLHKVLWCGIIPSNAPAYCSEGPDKLYGIGVMELDPSLYTMLHYTEENKSKKLEAFKQGLIYLIKSGIIK